MKPFVRDCALYFLLLLTVLFGIKSSVPYHWGNEEFTTKINYVNSTVNKFNSLGIGSSMFYRHLSPLEFNRLTNASLFNLGTTALFFLESNYLSEHYITETAQHTENTKNYFFLTQTPIPFNKNVHTIRGTYYLDFKRYKFAVKYFFPNYNQIFKYTKGFLENKLCIGQLRSMLTFHFKEFEISRFDISQMGFYSMDDQLRRENTTSLRNQKENFAKNPTVKTNQLNKDEQPTGILIDPKEILYKKELNRLSDLAAEKNISLISVSLPNTFYGYEKGDRNVLSLGTGKSYPEYFLSEYRFEQGHLNKEGARIFSRRLAKEYKKHRNSRIELSYY